VGRDAMSPGVAGLVLVEGVPLLHPEPQVFEAMLEGWRNQMLARNLAVSTITRTLQVRAFREYAIVYPWEWSASLADEWFADLRSIRHCTRSTARGYQVAIRGFCSYVTDPGYGWVAECERRFGTHAVQVITEVNAAAHVPDTESGPSKRAFTRAELQALFDYADQQGRRQAGDGSEGLAVGV
jgi:integrase/recombinase XerC